MTKGASSGGVGFGGLLTIVFITLRLTGVIDWSWLWVLAPVWIPVSVACVLCGLAGLLMLLARCQK